MAKIEHINPDTVAPYLPSDAFYFSPIKIYEYMACGVPVILSERVGA